MNADVRALVAKARDRGWVQLPVPGNHIRLRFPPTGDIITLPSTPSDHRSLKNCAALIARISGRLSQPIGNGPTKEERESYRRLERDRALARRRRTSVRPPPLRPERTTFEVAFDDYIETHDSDLAHEVEQLRSTG